MSVKDAAKTLGVDRPALSNLLNGKASLSPEMALRLEQAFGAKRQELLDLQAQYDRSVGKDKSVTARTYVPSFLSMHNGVWPCPPICEAMEAIASEHIARGFQIGINARGVYWRGEGGSQERELAAQYSNWAQQLAFDYPYVSSVIESIAALYDSRAQWHDSEENLRKRVGH